MLILYFTTVNTNSTWKTRIFLDANVQLLFFEIKYETKISQHNFQQKENNKTMKAYILKPIQPHVYFAVTNRKFSLQLESAQIETINCTVTASCGDTPWPRYITPKLRQLATNMQILCSSPRKPKQILLVITSTLCLS